MALWTKTVSFPHLHRPRSLGLTMECEPLRNCTVHILTHQPPHGLFPHGNIYQDEPKIIKTRTYKGSIFKVERKTLDVMVSRFYVHSLYNHRQDWRQIYLFIYFLPQGLPLEPRWGLGWLRLEMPCLCISTPSSTTLPWAVPSRLLDPVPLSTAFYLNSQTYFSNVSSGFAVLTLYCITTHLILLDSFFICVLQQSTW